MLQSNQFNPIHYIFIHSINQSINLFASSAVLEWNLVLFIPFVPALQAHLLSREISRLLYLDSETQISNMKRPRDPSDKKMYYVIAAKV